MKLFDGHCDTLLALHFSGAPAGALRENSLHVDLRRTEGWDAYAQQFAIFATPEMTPDGDGFTILYSRFLRELEANADRIAFCRSRSEAGQAQQAGKVAAFLSVEGAEVLGCSEARLEEAYEKGVRSLCLTWNRPTPLCGSCVADTDRGLSLAGRDYVRLAQTLGIVPDVSHLSDAGFWDLEKLVQGPFLASHSNARAIHPHPRNLTDDMLRAIRDHGGAVGLNLYTEFLGEGPVNIETAVRHLEHVLELGGEKTVAIGGDLDGCETLPERIHGIQDLPLLWAELERLGYPQPLLEDIFYNNLMRVMPA